jgi:hypothetical protein
LCFPRLPLIAQGLPLSQLGDPTANYLTSRRLQRGHISLSFQVPRWHGVALDFLLPLASTPLLAHGVGLGVIESSPSWTPIPTEDDEPQALVPHPVHQVLTPAPDSVHGVVPAHVIASSGFQAPGTTSVPPASTPAHSRHRGTAPMIVHPVAMTHD